MLLPGKILIPSVGLEINATGEELSTRSIWIRPISFTPAVMVMSDFWPRYFSFPLSSKPDTTNRLPEPIEMPSRVPSPSAQSNSSDASGLPEASLTLTATVTTPRALQSSETVILSKSATPADWVSLAEAECHCDRLALSVSSGHWILKTADPVSAESDESSDPLQPIMKSTTNINKSKIGARTNNLMIFLI